MSLKIIFNDRKFWPLYWTQFLGALNDNFLKNAMVVLVTYRGLSLAGLDSASIVALSGGIFILPFFLCSMLAGQIADKFEKSRLVRWVKIWELLITLVAAIGFYYHQVPLLLIALFMMGMHSTFFGPIKYSAIPDLVAPNQLVSANAYVETGTFLAILLGTIGGGLIIGLNHGEFWIGVAINICALLGVYCAWKIKQIPSVASALVVQINPVRPLLDTVRLLRTTPEVFQSILLISWFWFFGSALLSVLPVYCKDFLQVDESVVTTFLAMFTLGIGVGSLICARLSNHRVELWLVPLGALGLSVFLFDITRVQPEISSQLSTLMPLGDFINSSHGPRLLIDYFLMSVAGGFFILPLYTLLQERSAREFRSRVIAGNNVLNALFMVVAAIAILTLHLWQVTLPHTLLFLALGNIFFCAVVFWQLPEFTTRYRQWWNS